MLEIKPDVSGRNMRTELLMLLVVTLRKALHTNDVMFITVACCAAGVLVCVMMLP